MKFYVKHQEEYSRVELLLRSFLGFFYILIPHGIGLFIFGIGAYFIMLLSTLAVLFTGKYPQGMFNYMVKFHRWALRVNARMMNLADGYPGWGMDAEDDRTGFDVPYPEKLNWGLQWVKFLFGAFYCALPHFIIIYLRNILGMIYMIVAWLSVLFTGNYPKNMHDFNVGTMRWQMRVGLYLGYMSDNYPPFSAELQPYEQDGEGGDSTPTNDDVIDS